MAQHALVIESVEHDVLVNLVGQNQDLATARDLR